MKFTDLLLKEREQHQDVSWALESNASDAREVCDRINEMWEIFSRLADIDFVKQFARHPDNRYWEMFLGYHFTKWGFGKLDAPKPGPDLSVGSPQLGLFLIEAICLSSGEVGRTATLLPLRSGEAEWWPADKVAMRFTGAIKEKREKLQLWRSSGYVPSDIAYLIAINSAGLSGRRATHEDALSVVFAFLAGAVAIRVGPENQIVDEFRVVDDKIVAGSKIITKNGFLDGSLRDVSGIIHCPVSWMWPYEEMRLQVALIPNPTAAVSSPGGTLGFGARYDYRREGDGYAFVVSRE